MSATDVFEGAKVKVRATLVPQGNKQEDTAELNILQDGSTIETHQLQVKRSAVEKQVTAPNVPDAKSFYTLSWRVAHGTGVNGIDESIRVWPKRCKVKLVYPDDTPAKNTAFELVYSTGQRASFETNDRGERECTLKHRAPFSIRILGGARLIRFKPGKEMGRDREAIVAPWSAEIYAPSAPMSPPARQFVNLTSEQTGQELGHDARGREIAIVVGPRGLKDATSRPRTSVQKIYIQLVLSDLTKRTEDVATLEGVDELTRPSPGLVRATATIGGDGCARFTLKLGRGGGEKCKLQVGVGPDCLDDKREFINWRKLWIEPAALAGKQVSVTDAVMALKDVFVEAEVTAMTEIDATLVPGSMIPGAEVGLGDEDLLIVGNHNEPQFRPQIVNAHPGLTAHALFCDLQIDGGRAGEVFLDSSFEAKASHYVSFDDGPLRVQGIEVLAAQIQGFDTKEKLLLPRSVFTGNPSVTATWRVGSAPPTAIPPDHVRVLPTVPNKPGGFRIRYPQELITAIQGNQKVRVSARCSIASKCYNGWAPDGTTGVVIALQTLSGPRKASGYQSTIVHEIGHQLKQVGEGAPAGLKREDHGRRYTGRGHSGGHCAHGIDASVFNGTGDLSGRKDCGCIMYGGGMSQRPNTFCSRCKPFVLAEPITRLG